MWPRPWPLSRTRPSHALAFRARWPLPLPRQAARFHGAVCAHFTPENTTACTRVSLDFRVVPEAVWAAGHDRFSGEEGYYVRAERGEGDGAPRDCGLIMSCGVVGEGCSRTFRLSVSAGRLMLGRALR